jgi:hypothetical protein
MRLPSARSGACAPTAAAFLGQGSLLDHFAEFHGGASRIGTNGRAYLNRDVRSELTFRFHFG